MQPKMSGMLVVNKPAGMVSKDVSRYLTRHCGKKLKLGHVGTLDPGATGVLPVLVGSATRLQDYLLDLPKTYDFGVCFGRTTDTLDWTGEIVDEKPAHVDDAKIAAVLDRFRGEIKQVPPIYSAIKYQGKPLYKYAREGKADLVPLAELERAVTIFDLSCRGERDGNWHFRATCSKGTYVRVLAADIARALNTVGMVTSIHREQASGVCTEDAVQLDSVKDIEDLEDALVPLEELHLGLPNWQSIAQGWTSRLQSGQKLLVRSDHFNKNLKGEFLPTRPLFLLDERGSAFGLGVATPAQDGCMQISMKRGL